MEPTKPIFRPDSRTHRIYQTLLDYGSAGVPIKTLIEVLEEQVPQSGVASDVRAKLSVWSDADKNPHAKKFMVVTDREPKIGRPKKDDPADRQVAIITKGQEVPEWAVWSKANVEIPWEN
jgi:hypothetical protein